MLEHLTDPISFLKNLSLTCNSKELLIITVPYVKRSKVGLDYIRYRKMDNPTPENTHIFEFCPLDWKLIFLHSGWEVIEDKIYRQYPSRSIYWPCKILWKKIDYEGFYGAILRVNGKWRDMYKG